MARLFNDPNDFTDEFIAGFVNANSGLVRKVTGGVARATRPVPGRVAVVIGGGSGHYPAFGGLVGYGLAHGAAMGNIFASPSAQQVYSVARAVDAGAGILLTYGNYMGDVLNFTTAQEQLRSEGIRCETVVVTDDISSAPHDQREKRRGIAGDLVVFKAAGARADAGGSLEDVVAAANAANERTRSFGVAFSGLTLPGAEQPLFSVPVGRMAIGMGIHGEPGLSEVDLPTADELAELLTVRLLDERPPSVPSVEGARIAVVLNGLGSVKHEELYVLYGRVAKLLEDAGAVIVAPEVGELVTSFEMAGVSLTFAWLDDDLERLWTADVSAPAFRRGAVHRSDALADPRDATVVEDSTVAVATPESARAAQVVLECMRAMKSAIDANVVQLGELDSIAGDGDHGIGMQRGSTAAEAAAAAAVAEGAGAGTTLCRAADAWSDRAGGTSGLLWGILLRELGREIGDDVEPSTSTLALGIASGEREITRFGKAKVGDKTMVDVLAPVAESLADAARRDLPLDEALALAAESAERAAAATADLLPLVGRARPHAEKSLGYADPGASSLALLIRTVNQLDLTRKKDR